MGVAEYAIVPIRGQWGVLHDGDIKGEYATREAAFESAAAAASLAIREGHEVQGAFERAGAPAGKICARRLVRMVRRAG